MSADKTIEEEKKAREDEGALEPSRDLARATDEVDRSETNGSSADASKEGGSEAVRDDEGAGVEPRPNAERDAPKEDSAKDDAPRDESRESDLLPRGNGIRWKGLIPAIVGALGAYLLMAKNGQNGWGIPVGFVFIAILAFGVMDLLGTFDDAEDHVATRTSGVALLGPLARFGALGFAFVASLAAAQTALLSPIASAIVVTVAFLGLVACVFDVGRAIGPWKTDETGEERPLLHRHGFWVVAIGTLLYLPTLGLFSLWDPWETHYGEVAREVLARDDWISLWWAQDGWFWSKPILNFWIQSLSMGTLGTHFRPDAMLIAANGTAAAHPEWAVRTPNFLMTVGAMYLLYKGVAKVFGRRAGLLGAIVLATMPDWFFLAHQTMTDMPFVSAMTAAMGLLLFGLNTDENERIKVYEVDVFGRKLRLSLWHLVFGAVLLCALPQIVYLFSRNIELVFFGDGPKGFRVHWDEFKGGSAGNCGLPGNEACSSHVAATVSKSALSSWQSSGGPVAFLARLFGGFEPAIQAIVWAIVLGGVLYMNWGERRARRLVYIGAWLCAAIATMAKGPAGFGLPIICAFAYVATKKRWSEILRFEMVSGLLIILAVALPWYVAMYVRHGSAFTDRLIFHDMFNRAFSHVHDTNEGDDTGIRYYIWQLGYALFPWTGLAPLGLLWGFRRSDSALSRVFKSVTGSADSNGKGVTAVGDASVMLVMWFLFAYALFTFMGTKFHHYIFPAVPPIAMLVGIALDDMLGEGPLTKPRTLAFYLAGLGVTVILAVYGASRFWPGSIFGGKVEAPASMFSASLLGIAAIVVACLIFGALIFLFQQRPAPAPSPKLVSSPEKSPFRGGVALEEPSPEDTRRRSHENMMLGGAAIAAAFVVVLVGRDLAIKPEGADQPGAIRLLQLFTYNYRRPWPDTLDYNAILAGFTVIAALLGVALAVRALRRHVVAAFCAFAVLWAVWGLDVYMMALSPHWGQHEVIEAYYRDRANSDEQLIAYQMNWKGENFYTGNRIPAFVSSGATFQTWLKGQKEKGVKVMYFVTEHSRTGGLRSEVGAKSYKDITDKALCNKFILVRAEL